MCLCFVFSFRARLHKGDCFGWPFARPWPRRPFPSLQGSPPRAPGPPGGQNGTFTQGGLSRMALFPALAAEALSKPPGEPSKGPGASRRPKWHVYTKGTVLDGLFPTLAAEALPKPPGEPSKGPGASRRPKWHIYTRRTVLDCLFPPLAVTALSKPPGEPFHRSTAMLLRLSFLFEVLYCRFGNTGKNNGP